MRKTTAFAGSPLPSRLRDRRPRHRFICCEKTEKPVVIVGAGISGLAAAKRLAAEGVHVRLLEASDGVGGRIRSDIVDGCILDRGFQVFICGYPEQQALLDYEELDLREFEPGAMVRTAGGFYTIADPFRRPLRSLQGAFAPVGSLIDKLNVALLRLRLTGLTPDELLRGGADTISASTEEYLLKTFSSKLVDTFFRPFYQGIFLAPLSEQSASMFGYVFNMFAREPAALPAAGIGAFPIQIAQNLPKGLVSIELNKRITSLQELDNEARAVIIATEGPEAARLISNDDAMEELEPPASRGSVCVYFTSSNPAPIRDPVLVLNGDGAEGPDGGPVNNMFFPSSVCSSYAPDGVTLISTTVVGDAADMDDSQLEDAIRNHMSKWYGADEVAGWKHLRTYRVPHSQPAQSPTVNYSSPATATIAPGVFVCGDHRNTPTVNGALVSGRLAADEVLKYIAKPQ